MTDNIDPEQDSLIKATRLRRNRRNQWLTEQDMPIGRRLAQIGVLGWIFVAPTLAGLYLGRWLDAHFNSGIFWTAPGMGLGLIAGGWTAWRWMHKP